MKKEKRKILSIVIPTYNRAKYLDNCLNSIFLQITEENKNDIEIIVSDNCSTDNTIEIMEKYLKYKNLDYKFSSNKKNLGPDYNFHKLVFESSGSFCWIFGDNEYIEYGKLEKVLDILKKNLKIGILFLENSKNKKILEEYNDKNEFLKKVHYNIGFITGVIFNKEYLDYGFNYQKYFNKFMSYNYFYLHSLFKSEKSVIYNEHIFNSLSATNGGYKLFESFGKNFNEILGLFTDKGLEEKTIQYINRKLCSSFFPGWIIEIRKKKTRTHFLQENIYDELYPIFKRYVFFWIIEYPIIKLPLFFSRIYYFMYKIFRKSMNFFIER
ncbi:glycosyltransferase family 2 protein [Fusobacterium varium]|uniref:glycosyltransferase family 2 protein n=1 Tax=Fusobacterium varium TaxID=856 RepID=UPI0032BFF55B